LFAPYDDPRALDWLITADKEDRWKGVEIFRHSDPSPGDTVQSALDQGEDP